MKDYFVALNKSIYRATHWETWHWLLKYMPMIPFWILHCIRARSCWFFTAANPTLTFGGYEGETKTEMYDQLPKGIYPKTKLIHPYVPVDLMQALFWSNKFSFPVAVKPNVGRMGLMFRRLNSMSELINYHKQMPVDYLLQEYINYPIEVSVFYYRYPGHEKGTITGFVRKDPLSVIGDGKHTLLQLMLKYPRVQFRLREMKLKHFSRLKDIIPNGEKYILSEALNLSRGGKLVNLEHEKDKRLLALFDSLSHTGNFYFGRYDIKCASIDDLKNRKNFSVLEFNGSGAEPHHVYGNHKTLIEAIVILLEHWKILFRISRENHRHGVAYWNFSRGLNHLRQARKHFKILRGLELMDSSAQQKTKQENLKRETIIPRYTLTTEKAMR
jgi:hypothetical protein